MATQFTWRGWLLWVPPIILAVVVVVVMLGGFLRREREGSARWVRGLAYLLLVGYPITTWWLTSRTGGDFLAIFIPASCMWLSVTLISWQSLRSAVHLDEVALGVMGLLFGVATISYGVGMLRVGLVLFGVAFFLLEVGMLRDGSVLFGVTYLLVAVAALLAGVAALLAGVVLLVPKGSVLPQRALTWLRQKPEKPLEGPQ